MSVVAKGEGHDRLLREISLALAGRRGATILVAEDDDDLRGVLTASLTRNGHRVIQARDGAEALAAIERDQVDLLVLDLVMPNIDGFEVLARLKEIKKGVTIPVVVVTGTDRSTTELQALRLGANVYLTKPIEAAALTEEVTRLLTRRTGDGLRAASLDPGREPGRRTSGSSLDVAFNVISFLSRSTTIVTSPLRSSSSLHQIVGSLDTPAVDRGDDVAGLDASLRRCRFLGHARHQRAAVLGAEVFLRDRGSSTAP